MGFHTTYVAFFQRSVLYSTVRLFLRWVRSRRGQSQTTPKSAVAAKTFQEPKKKATALNPERYGVVPPLSADQVGANRATQPAVQKCSGSHGTQNHLTARGSHASSSCGFGAVLTHPFISTPFGTRWRERVCWTTRLRQRRCDWLLMNRVFVLSRPLLRSLISLSPSLTPRPLFISPLRSLV